MPCTLCYADGHNRRTCQRWDLLEAVRREESARLDMIRNNHLDIIAAANVAIATSAAAITATSAANTYDDIFNDGPSTPRTPPPRRHFQVVVPPIVPNAPRRMRTSRSRLPPGISSQTELVHLFQNIENVVDNDDIFSDLDSSFDWAELLDEPTPIATATPLVDCVKEPCKALDCPICMEDFQKTDVFITRCGHQFHGTCMIRHMKQYDNCPMCRGVLFSTSNR